MCRLYVLLIITVVYPQEYIYKSSVQGMIDGLFKGLNGTILAYGQTGSGKTYTVSLHSVGPIHTLDMCRI